MLACQNLIQGWLQQAAGLLESQTHAIKLLVDSLVNAANKLRFVRLFFREWHGLIWPLRVEPGNRTSTHAGPLSSVPPRKSRLIAFCTPGQLCAINFASMSTI